MTSMLATDGYKFSMAEAGWPLRRETFRATQDRVLVITWWDADVYKGVNDDDTQFLLSPGFGVDFRINEHLSVGSQMLFNIIPAAIHDHTRIDDQFYYSWEVVGLRLRF